MKTFKRFKLFRKCHFSVEFVDLVFVFIRGNEVFAASVWKTWRVNCVNVMIIRTLFGITIVYKVSLNSYFSIVGFILKLFRQSRGSFRRFQIFIIIDCINLIFLICHILKPKIITSRNYWRINCRKTQFQFLGSWSEWRIFIKRRSCFWLLHHTFFISFVYQRGQPLPSFWIFENGSNVTFLCLSMPNLIVWRSNRSLTLFKLGFVHQTTIMVCICTNSSSLKLEMIVSFKRCLGSSSIVHFGLNFVF